MFDKGPKVVVLDCESRSSFGTSMFDKGPKGVQKCLRSVVQTKVFFVLGFEMAHDINKITLLIQ